jgi:hypothetical protein
MDGDTSDKLYTAKDIEKHLGINANTLYHWVQVRRLIKPVVEGRGRGKAHKFDVENMATLLLTKILYGYPIELSHLVYIYQKIIDPKFFTTGKDRLKDYWGPGAINIWRIYKSNPTKHKKDGFYVAIILELGADLKKTMKLDGSGIGKTIEIDDLKGIKKTLDLIKEGKINGKRAEMLVSIIAIDLIAIIRNVERILGIEF